MIHPKNSIIYSNLRMIKAYSDSNEIHYFKYVEKSACFQK